MQVDVKGYTEKLLELEDSAKTMQESEFYSKFTTKFSCPLPRPYDLETLPLFRTRLASSGIDKVKECKISTFSYIPLDSVTSDFPKRGRMNKTGQSLFYASLSPDTNYKEIKHDVCGGEEVYLSKWSIKEGQKLSAYIIPSISNIGPNADTEESYAITSSFFTQGEWGEYLRCLTRIFTTVEDESEHKYLCSSYLANHILSQEGKAFDARINDYINFHYDAIMYPSVRIGNGKMVASNLVIKPNVVDKTLELTYVIKGTIGEDLSTLSYQKIGFPEAGEIVWYRLELNEVFDYKNIVIRSTEQKLYKLQDFPCTDKDGRIVTLERFLPFMRDKLDSQLLQWVIDSKLFKSTANYNAITKKEDLLEVKELFVLWPVEGWHLQSNKEVEIEAILFETTVRNSLIQQV